MAKVETTARMMGIYALETLLPGEELHETSDDLAPGVPDMRLPRDQVDALWLGETATLIDIEVPPMDQQILRRKNSLVWDGLGDRGACLRLSHTHIRIAYLSAGVTPESRSQATNYARAILAFYGLPVEALRSCRIGKRQDVAPKELKRRGLIALANPSNEG